MPFFFNGMNQTRDNISKSVARTNRSQQRALVYVPGTDYESRLVRLLDEDGFRSDTCRDLTELCQKISEGADAVLIADTQVREDSLGFLGNCLGEQPAWSDLPLILLTEGGGGLRQALEAFKEAGAGGNITVIQRPFEEEVNILNAVHVAFRARLRQYEARDLIQQREALLSSIWDSFIELNQEGVFRYVNERAAEIRGKKPEEMIGHSKWDLFPELVGTEYYRAVEAGLRKGVSGRVEYFDPVSQRWLEKRIYPSETGVSIFGTDITDRRHAEEALRESEARLRLIVESAREYAIFSIDLEGRITSWNTGAKRLLGYDEEEVLGRHVRLIFTEEDRLSGRAEAELSRALENDRAEDERWHLRKDGSRFWAGGLTTRMLDEEGQTRGFVKILRDYTGRKRAEIWLRSLNETLEKRVAERTAEAEQRATQLRMLASELTDAEQRERRRLAEILHDHLQQILVAAKMQVGMLTQRKLDESLSTALQRVDGLLRRSIDASRSLTVELSPPILYDAGLASALHWLSRNMLDTHRLQVNVEVEAESDPESDNIRAFLFQAVRELLFNVVKHANTSTATVTLRLVDQDVEVAVTDGGNGFDEEKSSNREKRGGFGLFSIRERVELLGGSLRIESIKEGGTRVAVRVPMSAPVETLPQPGALEKPPAVAGVGPAVSPSDEPTRDRIRILLADDHKILREGLAGLLREQTDFEVVSEASDGQMAVEMAHDTNPDVIVMDVSMPRLNGVEATRRLSSEKPEIAIIGLSMHAQEDMAESMRQAGAVAYVTKGAPSEILTATIREAYNRKKGQEE